MTGTLGLFSLVDLFQLLAASSRSGRLGVFHPYGTARIYFDTGQVVHAEFNELVGQDAIFALFADEQGSFDFKTGLPAPERSVETSTENLLLEVIRRLDEARRDGALPPDIADDAVPSIVPENEGKLTLQAEEQRVLSHVSGTLDVSEIAERAGLSLIETKRLVERLVKVGMIKLRSRKPRTARLVTQFSDEPLPPGFVGVEANIYDNWERTLGYAPERVACRRPNGRVDLFGVQPVKGAGPYLLLSHATLFRSDLSVNTTLLVKPASPNA